MIAAIPPVSLDPRASRGEIDLLRRGLKVSADAPLWIRVPGTEIDFVARNPTPDDGTIMLVAPSPLNQETRHLRLLVSVQLPNVADPCDYSGPGGACVNPRHQR